MNRRPEGQICAHGSRPSIRKAERFDALILPKLVGAESNIWCPRLTAAMILFGFAVQVNGFGSLFVSATKRSMAALRSATDVKTPRLTSSAREFGEETL